MAGQGFTADDADGLGLLHVGRGRPLLTWEPLVLGPAFAMERTPGPRWLKMKFSSSNLYHDERRHAHYSGGHALHCALPPSCADMMRIERVHRRSQRGRLWRRWVGSPHLDP